MSDITQHIDAVTRISDERLSCGEIQPPPKSVKIELTARCNLRCKFCAVRTRHEQPKGDMDFELFKKITTDMRYSGVEEIGMFFLGESFMAPKLLVMAVEWCKKELKFPYTFLTSNAALANSGAVSDVMAAGLDSLKWSVNCANHEQFTAITGGSEKQFNTGLDNIRKAFEARAIHGYKTMLSASSILYEGEQNDRMKSLLKDRVIPYVDKHYWLPLYQMAMYKERVVKELGYVPTAGNMGRIDDTTMLPTRKPLPCWTAFTEGHVRADGNLSACCFGSDEKFDMGMLDGKNFMACWNSEKFKALRLAQIMTLTEGQKALKGTACDCCVAYG